MGYLDPVEDIEAFGLPDGITQSEINQASSIVDSYLRRPEGLTYEVDKDGNPAWMTKLVPSRTLKAAAGISPGVNVVVPLGNAVLGTDMIGEVVVLDRGDPETCETAVVCSSQDAQNGVAAYVVLSGVSAEHAANCTLDFGLCILEESNMPDRRSVTQVMRPNFARLMSLAGRYGYGRRSDQQYGMFNEMNMLSTLSAFGSPALWEYVNVASASVSVTTGSVWVPAGIMLAYFTEVRVRYLAGWASGTLPENIKIATAMVATAVHKLGDTFVGGALASVKAGDQEFRRSTARSGGGGAGPRRAGADSPYLVPDAKSILDPYRVRTWK
jgi:hypothetical protein